MTTDTLEETVANYILVAAGAQDSAVVIKRRDVLNFANQFEQTFAVMTGTNAGCTFRAKIYRMFGDGDRRDSVAHAYRTRFPDNMQRTICLVEFMGFGSEEQNQAPENTTGADVTAMKTAPYGTSYTTEGSGYYG